jgi:hypothetical protein
MGLKAKAITQIYRLEHAADFMEAVRAPAQDLKGQVYLGWCQN